VTILGREITSEILERLQDAASGVSRRRLALQLCEWAGWVGPNGKFQRALALGIIGKLGQLGKLILPAVTGGRVPPRRSEPPANPVPVAPEPIEATLEGLGPVELILVGSRFSAHYRLWKGLLDDHHYLKAGPLWGDQLRYLIKCEAGWLGAAAFSAAARHVAARDQWIGWSSQARRENLHRVVNNSRLLILPHVRVPNLTSHVLGRLSEQVAGDWERRHGYRPVLAESFVDLDRYRGISYQAAGWEAIGISSGRGRQDAAHRRELSQKVLLARPLSPDFRRQLNQLPEKSRFSQPERQPEPEPAPPKDWLEEEFGNSPLGDQRLDKRLKVIAADFFARPTMNIPQSCGSLAKTKAAYRFFDNCAVNLTRVLEGHYQATTRRAGGEKVVLAVQDTTDLNYTKHPATEMLGPICDKEGVIGMLMHDTMAYNLEGTPLGLVDVQCWARDPELPKKSRQRYELEIEQKESFKWLKSYRAASRLQEQCPETMVVSVGDREADVYELFAEAQKAKAKLLVRAIQDRKLASGPEETECGKLWEQLRARAADGTAELVIPRQKNRPARLARLEIRFMEAELKPPKRKPHLGTVKLWAIEALEVGAQEGVEPVEWRLLTTVPVENLEQALERIRWYALRFQIEVYHRVLKSGCKIERRQLGNAERIEACLGIDLVVGWRVAHLTKLGREVPEVPCTVFFEEAQWQALIIYALRRQPPEQPPTLREAVRLLAMSLGGFLGRKSDGEPGATVIWRALERLDDLTQMWCAMRSIRWVSPIWREMSPDSS
jgi:hypothetical protein